MNLILTLKESNIKTHAKHLEVKKDSIETKSSFWLRILSLGAVDLKTVNNY